MLPWLKCLVKNTWLVPDWVKGEGSTLLLELGGHVSKGVWSLIKVWNGLYLMVRLWMLGMIFGLPQVLLGKKYKAPDWRGREFICQGLPLWRCKYLLCFSWFDHIGKNRHSSCFKSYSWRYSHLGFLKGWKLLSKLGIHACKRFKPIKPGHSKIVGLEGKNHTSNKFFFVAMLPQ